VQTGEGRLRAVAHDDEIVVVEVLAPRHPIGLNITRLIERVDRVGVGFEGDPTHHSLGDGAGDRMVLVGGEAEVCGFDAQRCIVRNEAGWADERLADGRTNNAVVGHGGIEPMVGKAVMLHPIDLDMQGR